MSGLTVYFSAQGSILAIGQFGPLKFQAPLGSVSADSGLGLGPGDRILYHFPALGGRPVCLSFAVFREDQVVTAGLAHPASDRVLV